MKLHIDYETEPCTRCGGSGTYSQCQEWGTTCFKCGIEKGAPGTGYQLTRKGKKAKAAYTAFRTTLLSIRADSLQIGDKFLASDNKWRTLIKAPHLTVINGELLCGAGHYSDSTCRELLPFLHIETQKISYCLDVDTTVVRQANLEELMRMAKFATGLIGKGIVKVTCD